FPKDVKALAAASKNNNLESKMLNATLEVNEIQPLNVVKMAEERLGVIKGKRIAILGLAFKPDTDDVRETRSEVVINELIEKGALVIGHDPKGMDNFKELIDIEMAETAIDAIKETDCIILMTEWKEYTELNYETIKGEMNGNVVIDGRRGFNQKRMEETGFDYKAIGLG
ncbi:NAD(P)-binding domain-containing protein, partial [Marine Group III euryarchaeote]|nr:NAD(P)-binding domain-containing protein [Marine Group III euryarchaeote]